MPSAVVESLLLFSRLSFALAASKIKEKARVVAMDLRGHGKSCTEDEIGLSIDVCICEIACGSSFTMYIA